MNRYAVYYRTSRTVVKAATEHDAYQKVAVLFGIEPTHAHKACRAFFLREDHNVNPATGVATKTNDMSSLNKDGKKLPAGKALAEKRIAKAVKRAESASKRKSAIKPTLGQRVEKVAEQPTKVDRKKEPKAASKPMSGLDAAALILSEAKTGMTAKAIVEAIKERGLGSGLKGKTPHATIYAAMITEISKKGEKSRFARGSAKGLFVAA